MNYKKSLKTLIENQCFAMEGITGKFIQVIQRETCLNALDDFFKDKYIISEDDLEKIKHLLATAQGFITATGMIAIPDHNKHVVDQTLSSLNEVIKIIKNPKEEK